MKVSRFILRMGVAACALVGPYAAQTAGATDLVVETRVLAGTFNELEANLKNLTVAGDSTFDVANGAAVMAFRSGTNDRVRIDADVTALGYNKTEVEADSVTVSDGSRLLLRNGAAVITTY